VYVENVYVENVYVVNTGNQRIQKGDNNGNFRTKLGSKGRGVEQFNSPLGISVDPKINNAYVVDSNNNRKYFFVKTSRVIQSR
jgi:DNA-binding beta-propeller fold protein YncE